MDMYTLLYLKWITNMNLAYIAQGTLLNIMWQPGWEGGWGRKDTCLCMSESLPHTPDTVTTLLIDCMPIQNKKLKKQELPLCPKRWSPKISISALCGNVHSPSAKLSPRV